MAPTISVLPAKARNFSAIADLLNHISDPVYIADSENKIVFANDYFCALTKFNHSDILGKQEDEIFRRETEPKGNDCIKLFFNSKNDLNVDSLIDAEGKEHTIIKLQNNFRHFDGDEYALVSIKNGSDYVCINEYLLHDVEKFGEVNRAKDKFIAAVSHDMRGPIGSIISSTDLLLDMFDKIEKDDIKKFVASINKTAKKSFHLLENLKLLTGLRTGKLKKNFEDVNIYEIMEDLISKDPSSSIKFEKSGKKKNGIIKGDKVLLHKIFKTLPGLMNGGAEISIKENNEKIILIYSAGKENSGILDWLEIDMFAAETFDRNELSQNLDIHLFKEIISYHSGTLDYFERDEIPVIKISFPKTAEKKVYNKWQK